MVNTLARIGLALFVIFGVVSIIQPQYMPSADPPYDKLLHLSVFGMVTLCACYSTTNMRLALTLAGLIVIAGLLIEIFQAFLPGRSADLPDAAANGLGALSVVVFYYFFGKHGEAAELDAIRVQVMDAYDEEKQRGGSSVDCLRVAANSYRAADPSVPEDVVRQQIIHWIEASGKVL